MVITRKNRGGYITAYMEYRLKDKYKEQDFCYVNDIWVHERYRSMGNVLWFMKRACLAHDSIDYVYFVRDKHNERLSVYEVIRTSSDIKFKRRQVKNEQ